MTGPFNHSLRVLACASCGAPIDVAIGGGRATCTYCGAENHLAARDERADRAHALASPGLTEMERYARLREQAASQTAELPRLLRDLVDGSGYLRADASDAAKRMWLETRRVVREASSFTTGERFFHLTRLLAAQGSVQGRRAFLEAAAEELPDEGHRHILRCELARYAAAEGDPEAAEEWLALCQARPLDLAMDTAYRLAVATVALVRGEHHRVLSLVDEDVPLYDRDALFGVLLRAHAQERIGRIEPGWRLLDERPEGSTSIVEALERAKPLRLCPGWRAECERRRKVNVIAELDLRRRGLDPGVRFRQMMRGVAAGGVLTGFFVGVVFVGNLPSSTALSRVLEAIGWAIAASTAAWFLPLFILFLVRVPGWEKRRHELECEIDRLEREGV